MRSREFLVLVILAGPVYKALTCGKGSPEWTRTTNPAINSRMLCQLSYGGPAARGRRGPRIPDGEYGRRRAGSQQVTGWQASSIEGVCITCKGS